MMGKNHKCKICEVSKNHNCETVCSFYDIHIFDQEDDRKQLKEQDILIFLCVCELLSIAFKTIKPDFVELK